MVDYHLFSQGPRTRELWNSVHDVITRIEELDFLGQLADGTLGHEAFVNYLLQDELYLDGYARAMSLLGAAAPSSDQTRFWVLAAGEAIADEQSMHAELLADPGFSAIADRLSTAAGVIGAAWPAGGANPTTLGYTSYLLSQAASAPYAVGVAAILPCFWVYAHIGKVLVQRVRAGSRDLAGHPFATWIEAYDSPDFDASVVGAVGILEGLLEAAPKAELTRMVQTFRQACLYELHFWAAAHVGQDWQEPNHRTPRG
ncbi:TenA family protein [Brevibacterium sp. 91QC2O2]|uniref:TenA family protein n=1 Tax=Brevibacterium sp. 91QC2O2 TaxID=2968458 RepID=UPI00211CD0EB|nr:TenA family protein [Brevibacterium sp. 91QC2O2]MCQ9367460.1 TenA family protein [Brevibacterium sp. 91QC2O2]